MKFRKCASVLLMCVCACDPEKGQDTDLEPVDPVDPAEVISACAEEDCTGLTGKDYTLCALDVLRGMTEGYLRFYQCLAEGNMGEVHILVHGDGSATFVDAGKDIYQDPYSSQYLYPVDGMAIDEFYSACDEMDIDCEFCVLISHFQFASEGLAPDQVSCTD